METFSGEWWEKETITSVEKQDDWYIIGIKGSGFGLKVSHGVEPKVGDTVELYGEGFGRPIDGVRINGNVVFQNSDEQIKINWDNEKKKSAEEKQKKFDENKAELDKTYDALPPEFKVRLDRLRAKRPGFRVDHEAYELFVCKDAVKIAVALRVMYPTGDALFGNEKDKFFNDVLKKFYDLKTEEQKQAISDLDYENHSMNTFGAACKMAHLYIIAPKMVKYLHGSMATLTGCDGFGCHPLTDEEEVEMNSFVKEYSL
jgi:hypothetical protein